MSDDDIIPSAGGRVRRRYKGRERVPAAATLARTTWQLCPVCLASPLACALARPVSSTEESTFMINGEVFEAYRAILIKC